MRKIRNRSSRIYLFFGCIMLACTSVLVAMGLIIDHRIFYQLIITLPIGLLMIFLGMRNSRKSERAMRNESSTLMPAVDEREKELSGRAAYITWWIGLGAFTLVIYVYAMLCLYAGFDPTFMWWIAALMWVQGFSMPIIYVFLSRKS